MSFKTYAIYIHGYASCFMLIRIAFSFRCFVSWLLLTWQRRNKTSALPSCDHWDAQSVFMESLAWSGADTFHIEWIGCAALLFRDGSGVRTSPQHQRRASIVAGYRSTAREVSTEKIVLDRKLLQTQNKTSGLLKIKIFSIHNNLHKKTYTEPHWVDFLPLLWMDTVLTWPVWGHRQVLSSDFLNFTISLSSVGWLGRNSSFKTQNLTDMFVNYSVLANCNCSCNGTCCQS